MPCDDDVVVVLFGVLKACLYFIYSVQMSKLGSLLNSFKGRLHNYWTSQEMRDLWVFRSFTSSPLDVSPPRRFDPFPGGCVLTE